MGEIVSLRKCFSYLFGVTCLSILVALVGLSSEFVHAQSGSITDTAILDQGQKLFKHNCAVCHGENAKGSANDWHVQGDDGKYPPPPLNGTAHTWHHSLSALLLTVRNGTIDIGGSMPGWKDQLSDDEIFSVVIWITSLWPDELYQSWNKRNSQ